MTSFAQALKDKPFVVSLELDPPRGTDLKAFMDLAGALASRVDAIVLSDHRGAVPRMSPWWPAHKLVEHTPAEVIVTVCCRDRNRLALTGDLLAMAAAGVENLLMVSGDFTTLGDHPQAKPVYDLDSVQALLLAARLGQGQDLSGATLDGAPQFFVGAVAAPAANPWEPQAAKLRKKINAGAGFLMTLPLKSAAALEGFWGRVGAGPTPLIATVEVSDPGQRDAAVEMVKQIKSGKLAGGVHLALPADQAGLPAFLDACGL
ncbi:MAG: methylenetetrahydrofolate reductase [Pseudomonadota bacterium]